MYYLPRVCRTLVSEICVRPEMPRVFRYIDVLTCVFSQLKSKDDWSYSSAIKIIDEDRVGERADTWYTQIQTTKTVEL